MTPAEVAQARDLDQLLALLQEWGARRGGAPRDLDREISNWAQLLVPDLSPVSFFGWEGSGPLN